MNAEQMKAMFCLDRLVWGALASTLDKHQESVTSAGWTIRDVYLNFARWLNHSNSYIEAYRAGRREQALKAATTEEAVTQWQQEDSQISLEDAREKARKAFVRRLDIIGYKPPGNAIREAFLYLDHNVLSLSRCSVVQ